MRFPTPDVTTPFDLITYVNTISGGWFGVGIAVIVLFISLIYMGRRFGTGGILTSFVLATIVAILLRAGGVISDTAMTFFIAATIAVYVITWLKK